MGEGGQSTTTWTIHIYETHHHRGGYSITKQHSIEGVPSNENVTSFVARLADRKCDTSDIVKAFRPFAIVFHELGYGSGKQRFIEIFIFIFCRQLIFFQNLTNLYGSVWKAELHLGAEGNSSKQTIAQVMSILFGYISLNQILNLFFSHPISGRIK